MTISINLSEEEINEQRFHENTLKLAKHIFDVNGFLKIENLFPKEFIQRLAEAYTSQLQYDEENMTLNSGNEVSYRRYIVPIAFKPPFNDPQLYANAILMPLMKEILGSQFMVSGMGSVTALPGSTDQHLHQDYFPLFEENIPLSNNLPTFAVTFALPLLDIDLINGPTKIWSSSHRTYPIDKNMHSYTRHFLCGPIGSCYFWDYRTFHAGGSNHSDHLRSLLYMSYTRNWFKDLSNPDYLLIDEENYRAIPAEHQKLFPQCQNLRNRYTQTT
jgi:ectoine hydroxylase-related dioxygenase (phytanoyl-CoA dioxygenase family)